MKGGGFVVGFRVKGLGFLVEGIGFVKSAKQLANWVWDEGGGLW